MVIVSVQDRLRNVDIQYDEKTALATVTGAIFSEELFPAGEHTKQSREFTSTSTITTSMRTRQEGSASDPGAKDAINH